MRRLSLVVASLGLATAASAEPVPVSPPPAGPSTGDPAPGAAPIIGGTPTTVGQYPSVVALSVGGGLCSGTLIAPDWVLTAAHCVTPAIVGLPSQQAVTQNIRILFKTVNLQQSQGTVRMASDTIPKPGFSIDTLGANDIGLVKLSQPVTDIEPTPVNLDPARAPVGTTVAMVGYGATMRGGAGMVGVQFALQDRVSTACSAFGASDANLLCFSQTDNKGKCQGDSGGPSFAQIGGRTEIVGVTSFGDQQCAQFGADTRTDIEKDFLLMHIPTLGACETDAECPGKVCFNKKCIAQPFSDTGIGATCTAGAECDSGQCADGPGGKRCTEICVAGSANACPDGFECLGAAGTSGACWPADDGGCCDASGRGAPTMLFGVAVVGLALRRRRR
ncbi:MAG TPA: serine protease [Kofleriaceae bacterium]|nr:serine protease [Kofleriaceae bacterium]